MSTNPMGQAMDAVTPMASSYRRLTGVRVWFPLAALAVLWIDLIFQLGATWSASEQYAFGWFVPLLSAGLFLRNWWTRPAPRPEPFPAWMIAGIVLVALALLPVRIIHEINRDWPLFTWPLTAGVVGISLVALYAFGGWPWVRHFAFPVCFILIAVKWPHRIEHGLIQGLMRLVAAIGVEILGLLNIPALQKGNTIEIANGVLGIDEACSGIRSFQTTLMAALFLGEQYRLSWRRRGFLLVGGVLIAFALNVLRTLLLSWSAATHGMESVDKWHDPAGLTIVIACFLCLWGFAAWFAARPKSSVAQAPDTEGGSPAGNPSRGSGEPVGDVSETTPNRYNPTQAATPSGLPGWFAFGVFGWLALMPLVSDAWYRLRSQNEASSPEWSVNYPTNAPGFGIVEIPKRAQAELLNDEAITGAWIAEDGTRWTVYWLRWHPRASSYTLKARQNRPEACLPGAGWRLVENAGIERFEAGPLQIPFRRYTFEAGGVTVHVFFCLWETGVSEQGGSETTSRERLRLAWNGQRILGQQTMEIILHGYPSLDAATVAVRKALPGMIQVVSGSSE